MDNQADSNPLIKADNNSAMSSPDLSQPDSKNDRSKVVILVLVVIIFVLAGFVLFLITSKNEDISDVRQLDMTVKDQMMNSDGIDDSGSNNTTERREIILEQYAHNLLDDQGNSESIEYSISFDEQPGDLVTIVDVPVNTSPDNKLTYKGKATIKRGPVSLVVMTTSEGTAVEFDNPVPEVVSVYNENLGGNLDGNSEFYRIDSPVVSYLDSYPYYYSGYYDLGENCPGRPAPDMCAVSWTAIPLTVFCNVEKGGAPETCDEIFETLSLKSL